jgi:hypothetical protein
MSNGPAHSRAVARFRELPHGFALRSRSAKPCVRRRDATKKPVSAFQVLFWDALARAWRYYDVMIARVYRGTSSFVPPVLTIDGSGRVYQGLVSFGNPVLNIDGDRIYKGRFAIGPPIATLRGNYVYPGAAGNSAPIATVDGETAYKGINAYGMPVATAQGGGKMGAAVAAVYFLLLQDVSA